MTLAVSVMAPLAQAQSSTIKIVSSLPRTGSSKGQTDTIVNAMKMAFEDANYTAGGFTIEYEDMDDATRTDMAAYTGCIAGALTEDEFRAGLAAVGFTDIEIRETHRVHEHAAAAIVRARKPDAAGASSRPPGAGLAP